MIDAVQRLGIDYHFQQVIDEILHKQMNMMISAHGDLHEVALHFRLLRHRGTSCLLARLERLARNNPLIPHRAFQRGSVLHNCLDFQRQSLSSSLLRKLSINGNNPGISCLALLDSFCPQIKINYHQLHLESKLSLRTRSKVSLDTSPPAKPINYETEHTRNMDDILVRHSHKLESFRNVLRNLAELEALEGLNMIDAVQRLGIDYHFQQEIDEILHKQMNMMICSW
ncbi:hypothetical protein M0R45_004844 [Rubus argutus]|uniref:Terpene synthase N-terminal domain-containing protein n=1 Tax=Rubus argutus TaxID=59490 RepID=A0AAW1YLB2_RUBAR